MGQYFTFVNVDKQEVVHQPEGTKLPEIVSSGLSGQVMMYLLFDGPFDGTTLLHRLYDDDNETAQQLVEDLIDREKERENKSEHDRQSGYRTSDGGWDRDRLRRVALSQRYTGDHTICGRWAGDDVRIIGDYADERYYFAERGVIVAERDTGEIIEWLGSHPSPIGGRPDDAASRGDQIDCYQTEMDSPESVEFITHRDSEWADITDSVFAEMSRYMPSRFGQLDDGSLEPAIEFGRPPDHSHDRGEGQSDGRDSPSITSQ